MAQLALHGFHEGVGAKFGSISGMEVVDHYGDPSSEYAALTSAAAVVDLSARGRVCVLGPDRARFLHGQITNRVLDLETGHGCYAALVTAKGKIQSDLNVYCLQDEFLLDFEPGLTGRIIQRLESYLIADDVQLLDAAPHYGLLSVQGPRASEVVSRLGFPRALPAEALAVASMTSSGGAGDIYCMNLSRGRVPGFDLFVPNSALPEVAGRLLQAASEAGGRACGWQALETARIEAGRPRFGLDMDETNLVSETGLEERAISYNKGCYIGQEVIARIRTYGQVAKSLRGLVLPAELKTLPVRGQPLHQAGREVGYFTSAVASPAFRRNLALGYVRRESNAPGTELTWHTPEGDQTARVVPLPFSFEGTP